MVSKRKTKLVCVGWGVIYLTGRKLEICFSAKPASTKKAAIKQYDQATHPSQYKLYERRGLAIAKKLWVEVKNEQGR